MENKVKNLFLFFLVLGLFGLSANPEHLTKLVNFVSLLLFLSFVSITVYFFIKETTFRYSDILNDYNNNAWSRRQASDYEFMSKKVKKWFIANHYIPQVPIGLIPFFLVLIINNALIFLISNDQIFIKILFGLEVVFFISFYIVPIVINGIFEHLYTHERKSYTKNAS